MTGAGAGPEGLAGAGGAGQPDEQPEDQTEKQTEDHEGYSGPAVLVLGGHEVRVEVDLRGFFQPIDGRYHWYGRIAADPRVTGLVEAGARTADLRTPAGSATGSLGDPDPWGRYRVAGTGAPPFTAA
ncbi:DUF4873 domain-containing protein [Actinosynnema pretiosum subsp. pretiosum]|uniref:DUF4873 domain-containing protein n=1 Tax=Actinosynnema pretiosum subsp. pretiosum TaxID=103721 RepID=A0AA45LBX0_9PSEU|nr:putative flavin binding monooxygenase [Actinosynnema pretiosum subsp. pretiosum]QUF07469.1 DUF4873 domain-containing protein [Actinosynnema pretiosum subsp. pretiosum]